MSSKTSKSVPLTVPPPHAESHKEQNRPDSDAEALNQGQVHSESAEPAPAKARIHMDQIDAVATPQGVVLFALTEGGDIWQLTSFSGQPEWTHILTPEAPAEEV